MITPLYQRDLELAAQAAGTPINDGTGDVMRNGLRVSAGDLQRSAATRLRNQVLAGDAPVAAQQPVQAGRQLLAAAPTQGSTAVAATTYDRAQVAQAVQLLRDARERKGSYGRNFSEEALKKATPEQLIIQAAQLPAYEKERAQGEIDRQRTLAQGEIDRQRTLAQGEIDRRLQEKQTVSGKMWELSTRISQLQQTEEITDEAVAARVLANNGGKPPAEKDKVLAMETARKQLESHSYLTQQSNDKQAATLQRELGVYQHQAAALDETTAHLSKTFGVVPSGKPAAGVAGGDFLASAASGDLLARAASGDLLARAAGGDFLASAASVAPAKPQVNEAPQTQATEWTDLGGNLHHTGGSPALAQQVLDQNAVFEQRRLDRLNAIDPYSPQAPQQLERALADAQVGRASTPVANGLPAGSVVVGAANPQQVALTTPTPAQPALTKPTGAIGGYLPATTPTPQTPTTPTNPPAHVAPPPPKTYDDVLNGFKPSDNLGTPDDSSNYGQRNRDSLAAAWRSITRPFTQPLPANADGTVDPRGNDIAALDYQLSAYNDKTSPRYQQLLAKRNYLAANLPQ